MNWDIIEGKWNHTIASIKAKYADFTDDELAEVKANWEMVSAKMQEKYGWSKAEADEKVSEIQEEIKDMD